MHNASRAHPSASAPPWEHRRHWRRIGLWLVGATLAYNVAGRVMALWAGLHARSIALVGFGLDSVIEYLAATGLLWRLGIEARGSDPETIGRSERRVHRCIGGTFLALTLYVFI